MRSIFAFLGLSILAAGAAFAQAAGGGIGGGGPGALPAPPPASVTTPPALSGVPPTPAPATPGLPAPPASGGTPSTTGQDNRVTNELRPSTEVGANQVSSVQAALSAGGFYRGPVDGVLSGPTRSAIRAFQASARLPATGQLDGETAAALGVLNRAPASIPGQAGSVGNTPAAIPGGGGTVGAPMTPTPRRSDTPFELSVPPPARPFPESPIFIQP